MTAYDLEPQGSLIVLLHFLGEKGMGNFQLLTIVHFVTGQGLTSHLSLGPDILRYVSPLRRLLFLPLGFSFQRAKCTEAVTRPLETIQPGRETS